MKKTDMISEITFRVGDLPAVEALMRLRESVGWGESSGDCATVFEHYSTTVSAYSADEELIGWTALVSDGVRHAFFVDVIVDPLHQGKGIGRELVTRAIDVEQARGISLFHADFAKENAPFYAACGFTLCGGAYLDTACSVNR